ncbi:MAG: hypothetical protein AVDCRST_MAG13-1340 [uncultured Solirubrobacteraceae bacterium]|uniref:GYD domain-containing protein n=1 Tax=uncultured Solirubrobacteraceae bacterium TaxID=1162706 RepID=A0A6J4RWL7_9ACTN|nr:MAG: hypothetical protein AVDCRST_MAG13-1340 [uncultured Solirubrobacteraceae bacterium]
MNTYIVLCKFDRAGTEGIGEAPVDGAAARALAQDAGATVQSFWFTVGTYDLVAVVSAPDTRKALAFLVAFSRLGRVSTVTLTAEEDVAGVLQDAQEAHTKHEARDAHTKHEARDAHTKHEAQGG